MILGVLYYRLGPSGFVGECFWIPKGNQGICKPAFELSVMPIIWCTLDAYRAADHDPGSPACPKLILQVRLEDAFHNESSSYSDTSPTQSVQWGVHYANG
jgi:hypothetical protein